MLLSFYILLILLTFHLKKYIYFLLYIFINFVITTIYNYLLFAIYSISLPLKEIILPIL